uniref:Uncharacterized protein TCIL3000_7_1360 n=1 Tax=Trypanosoma congolense (strain IL3000) TaxID=1068625 RepID=G0UPL9_TRYCI|nr:unnamed protein product [Trypanosoma congolense IL3000]
MQDSDVRPLCDVQTLEELTIRDSVGVVNLGNIGHLPRIHTLALSGTGVIDECLCGLSLSKSLRRIDLCGCLRIKDVEPLSQIQTLEEVDVSGCFPCVCGIGALGKLPHLRYLKATLTGIRDECLVRLSVSRCLVKLLLSNCERLTNVQCLARITSLEELDLSDCVNVTEGIGDLGRLPSLKSLDISGTGTSDVDLCGICKSLCIEKLILKRCKLITDVFCLQNLPTLQHVNIGECSNIIEGFGVFSVLPELRTLYVHHTAVTDNDLRAISMSNSLVSLNIASCSQIADVSCLSDLKTLEEININLCEGINKGLVEVSSLPNLRSLDACSTAVDDNCLEKIAGSTTLERGYLAGCVNITDVTPLVAVKSLEYVNLDECTGISGIKELSSLPLLRVISLRGTRISEEELKELKKSNRRLYIER